ncbi:MAG: hypothetical protein ACYTG5_21110 [Planctomycetota bacterium]|jgi:hypothetical protein
MDPANGSRPPEPEGRTIVSVRWLDSVAGGEWFAPDGPQQPDECWTIGFLIASDTEALTIVSTVSGDQALGDITIPRRAVVEYDELEGL